MSGKTVFVRSTLAAACALGLCVTAGAQKVKEGRIKAMPSLQAAPPAPKVGQTDWQKYVRDRRWEDWQRARRVYTQDVKLEGDTITVPGEKKINEPQPEDSAAVPDRALGVDYDEEADAAYVATLRARDQELYIKDPTAWRRYHESYLHAHPKGNIPGLPANVRGTAFDRFLLERDFDAYRTDKAAWQKAYRAAVARPVLERPESAVPVRARNYERERSSLLNAFRPAVPASRRK